MNTDPFLYFFVNQIAVMVGWYFMWDMTETQPALPQITFASGCDRDKLN